MAYNLLVFSIDASQAVVWFVCMARVVFLVSSSAATLFELELEAVVCYVYMARAAFFLCFDVQ